ncbi:MAG: RNA 2',3'-cyclic phosphodiesterase [Coriobacteriia bacterium]|nr:RNA 2',3'-cyclic phosphodiesterase [Coriobacteriia bacterium]
MNLTRCFVGVRLAEDVVRVIENASRVFLAADPSWSHEKWVRAENLHLTLAFIGRIKEDSLPLLLSELDDTLRRFAGFELLLKAVAPVPSPQHARMLWASLADPQGMCESLAHAVLSAIETRDAKAAEKPFRPHITLSRARHPMAASADAIRMATETLGTSRHGAQSSVSVSEVTLFSSTLTPLGPKYEVIHEWRL